MLILDRKQAELDMQRGAGNGLSMGRYYYRVELILEYIPNYDELGIVRPFRHRVIFRT